MKNVTCYEVFSQKGHLKYLEELREISRRNRRKLTKAEANIWYQLLKNKKIGYKFTKQKPLNRFVLDFYCSELLIAIEVDGSSHIKKENYDNERDKFLNCLNIKTIRFTNDEVFNNINKVKNELIKILEERKTALSREVSQRDGGFK